MCFLSVKCENTRKHQKNHQTGLYEVFLKEMISDLPGYFFAFFIFGTAVRNIYIFLLYLILIPSEVRCKLLQIYFLE